MRVIVAGSRTITDYEFVSDTLDQILGDKHVTIVSGACRGVDQLGERYAEERGHSLILCPANWETFGKKAGPIRNEEMAEIATHAIIFLENQSKGAKNMITLAKKKGLELRVIKVDKL